MNQSAEETVQKCFDNETAKSITVFVDVQGYVFEDRFYVREVAIKQRNGPYTGYDFYQDVPCHQNAASVKRQLAKLNMRENRLGGGCDVEDVLMVLDRHIVADDVVCVDNDYLYALISSVGVKAVRMGYGEEEWRLRRLYWDGIVTQTCERHRNRGPFRTMGQCAYFVVQAMELIVNEEIQ